MRRAAAIFIVSLVTVVVLAETGRPLTDLNLRAAPTSRKSNVVTVLRTSDEFEILETRRGWYRVRLTKTGVEGWVAQKYVRLTPRQQTQVGVADTGNDRNGLATGGSMAMIAGLLALIGYITGYKTSDINSAPSRPSQAPNRFVALLLCLSIGTLYVTLTLPKLLIVIATDRGWTTISQLGRWSLAFNDRIASPLPGFAAILQCVFWVALFYLLSLFVLAVRHGSLQLFRLGALTLMCSILMFYFISWTGYILVKVLTVIFLVLKAIVGALGWILATIGSFLAGIVVSVALWIYGLLNQLLGSLWWLVPVGLVVVLAVALLKGQTNWGAILKVIGKLVAAVTAVALVIFVLRWLWKFIAPWLIPILKFLAAALGLLGVLLWKLFIGLGVLVVLTTVGQLFVDQVQSALAAGRRRRGVVIGALAIGASIAILLLVSNVYNVNTGLPAFVMAFAATYLHQPAPLVDALVAFGIVALSIVGVWRNMPALGQEPTSAEFNRSLVYSVFGVFVAGGLAALGGIQVEE